jgi:hypothetical protein
MGLQDLIIGAKQCPRVSLLCCPVVVGVWVVRGSMAAAIKFLDMAYSIFEASAQYRGYGILRSEL